ncbi:MAG: carbamoyl phosphate synthase small subunit [Opitutae bacterium]|nr:carbamoyl phosphate synthase small subunit [Opitutae bacterium]|tara:strand:- start:9085 stop:10266 length:1182 start_codon:yes stop_codon:yes gene_type:complete
MDNSAKIRNAVLALEDGSVFRGFSFGASTTVVGEAVFNTGMTGYQETLSDPSYFGQIVTMTSPQIGNYGVNDEDEESNGPKVSGFVVRELSPVFSNWRATGSLSDYLEKHSIPGIEGVDTRSITKRIRVNGALKACLSTEEISDEEALNRAKQWPGIEGRDFVKEVTCEETISWDPSGEKSKSFTVEGTHLKLGKTIPTSIHKLVAFDYGAKRAIFNNLRRHGFEVIVVPADASVEEVRAQNPDGVFLSNGPGDPSALDYAHKTVQDLLPDFPIFGICLGHQVITHAIGASTYKLKFGHRGANQPVKNIETERVSITSQNHGFASDKEKLEEMGAVVTEYNLNDQTVSGMRLKDLPVFSVQYHPEASPGPNDANHLFQAFHQLISDHKENQQS